MSVRFCVSVLEFRRTRNGRFLSSWDNISTSSTEKFDEEGRICFFCRNRDTSETGEVGRKELFSFAVSVYARTVQSCDSQLSSHINGFLNI